MKNIDSIGHVTGKSVYLDDIPIRKGTLYALPFASTIAHGKINCLDITAALEVQGVVEIFTHKDIPGENQIGGIIPDEPLFAENEVHFIGQPIGCIIAEDERIARKARALIDIEYEVLLPILDPREAAKNDQLLFPPRSFQSGNLNSSWEQCAYIYEGVAESGGQEHLYIETQGAYVLPEESGKLKVYSSTQGPTLVQKTIASVLNIPMHKIEVDVQRLGGAFGGKEDQATVWACMAAMAAQLLNKPVKIVLHRMDDIQMTGKRHPYSSGFKIGLSKELKILAFETNYYQNGGAAADLSPAILERTLFHITNAYYIPNVKATAYSCKTNLPPNTAFRGFGGPQAMFVIESAIAFAANQLNISASVIQEKNLLNRGDEFPYGQKADENNAIASWRQSYQNFNILQLKEDIEAFNRQHPLLKKGLAMMPICFGISFTKTPMNQARSLVHIYQDGSLGISSGAVEMGQGVNTKLLQIASRIFSIDPKRVKIETTNTSRVANTSPTAASSGADLNGKALEKACNSLLFRLKEIAAEILDCKVDDVSIQNEIVYIDKQHTQLTWEELIETTFLKRKSLTEVGHYATPIIHFDKTTEKGHPFAYHVYGTAAITTTVDCLRGIYSIDDVKIVHDFGSSMNPMIDKGQVEGAVVQGIGWMTLEELAWDEKGRYTSNSLSTYKVPDIYAAPKNIDCEPLGIEGPELAILKSKAVGEPPFMYGIASFFAIQNAIKSFNPNYQPKFDAPFTPEKVLLALYENNI